jgi:hypothetical protein
VRCATDQNLSDVGRFILDAKSEAEAPWKRRGNVVVFTPPLEGRNEDVIS